MLFPNIFFLLYFLPAALILHWLCPPRGRNVVLFLLSLVFYAWGEPLFLAPMLLLIVVNHRLGRSLDGADNPNYKRMIIKRAAIIDAGILLAVLYGETAVRFVAGLLGYALPETRLPVPAGIAFFALQALAYVIEVSRGKARPEQSIVDTGLFIAFLPTVLAGPVLRPSDIAERLRRRTLTLEQTGLGFERLLVGLAKLVVLAVPINHMASDIFARSAAGNQFNSTPVVLAWLGVFAFGLQYYLTFSGFADMAIGIARLFGFAIPENFRYPYYAHTVTEFWKRWNVTVFRWFYVYVFLYLGGTRAKMVRFRGALRPRNYAIRNSLVLWALIGLWHGLSWPHLVFGLWFFIFFVAEWVVSLQRKDTGSVLWRFYVLFVVAVGWVFLRSYSFAESMTYLSNMLGVAANGFTSDFAAMLIRENWPFLLAGALACTPAAHLALARLRGFRSGTMGSIAAACHIAVLSGLAFLCYVFLGEADSVPFLFYY